MDQALTTGSDAYRHGGTTGLLFVMAGLVPAIHVFASK
jgi:hypothetical protein